MQDSELSTSDRNGVQPEYADSGAQKFQFRIGCAQQIHSKIKNKPALAA